MTDTTIEPTDYLKYVAAEGNALIELAQCQLVGLGIECPVQDDQIEVIADQLDAVRRMLIESAATFCRDGHDLDHYSDGSPVQTRLELEKGNEYQHRWHPYREHRANRPGEVMTWTTTSGARKRIVVTARGVLDAVTIEPLRSVE